MKKWARIFLIAILVIIAAGCINGGVKQNVTGETTAAETVVSDSEIKSVETEIAASDEENKDGKEESVNETSDIETVNENVANDESDTNEGAVTAEGSDDIDVDLTAISGILVYSEVYNMMASPANYMGKKIKMEGIYAIYFDDTYSTRYDACIVQDATACCATGIEFELSDELKYPDDYPEEGDIITVEGIFDTYDEGSYTYCVLRNASLLKVEE